MSCSNCGAALDEGQQLCPRCGVRVSYPGRQPAGAAPSESFVPTRSMRADPPQWSTPQSPTPDWSSPPGWSAPVSAPPGWSPPGALPPAGRRLSAAGLVLDLAMCAALLGGGLLVASEISIRFGGAGDVVSRLGWAQALLAVAVLAVYWLVGLAVFGLTAGEQLARVLNGLSPTASFWSTLWPSLLTVAVAALVGGTFVTGGAFGRPTVAAPGGPAAESSDPLGQSAVNVARAQAVAVDELLTSSRASKVALGAALGNVCRDTTGALSVLRRVEGERTTQLGRGQQLDLGMLPSGERMRGALIEALAHSLNADRAYVAWAEEVERDGCGAGEDHRRSGDSSSALAQVAKKAFLELWNPVAAQYSLPSRTSVDI